MMIRTLSSLLLASFAWTITTSCGVRAGNVVLLPAGFEGWVVVHYEVSGSPPFGREGVKTLIQIPPAGSVFSSSTRSRGYGLDEYYFVGPEGKRIRVKSEDDGCTDQETCVRKFQFFFTPTKFTRFFVGKKQDLSHYPIPEAVR